MNLLDLVLQKSSKDPSEIGNGELITFLNPYSYLIGRSNVALFRKFDRIYVDGISLVAILRIISSKKIYRASFDYTSIAKDFFKYLSARPDKSIYIVGSTDEAIGGSVQNINKTYPGLNIVGFRSGFFSSDIDRDESIESISALNPDFVIVGMGTPLQEKFLVDLRESGWKGTGYTCGGYIHQSSERLDYYPRLVDQLNIRWTYRIWKEPKLFKRYFYYYPLSVIFLLRDYFKSSR